VPDQAPKQIKPTGLADYLEVMSKAVFQSGMSWQVVESKWDGFRDAFKGFDTKKVSKFTPDDVERLVKDERIIRNRKKIEATIDNAIEIEALDKEYGGFQKYLRSHDDFEATVKDMRKHFRFMGDFGAYYFLHVVGEKVPPHDEFQASRK
jgi:DNA-3-methyladenine glycosylase I